MNQAPRVHEDRIPLLITLGVFLLALACLPLAWMADGSLEKDRPMYQDILRMQGFQALHVADGAAPIEATVADGESVEVGTQVFTPSSGVTVVVRTREDGTYCVSASNERGEKSGEHCSEAAE